MVWTLVTPTCNQSTPRVGVIQVPANAIAIDIPVCAPTPPYPLFITLSWGGDFQYTADADNIHIDFAVSAPGDGSGLASYEWETP